MDMCRPFRPRSGACHRCCHLRPSGEASQPGHHAPAGTLTPNPVRTLLRFGCVRSTSARSASRLSVDDRWPCATGLASYPSSCIHHLNRTTPFSVPPVARILSRLRGHRRFPGVSSRIAQSATDRIPFHPPAATPEGFSGFDSICPEPLDGGPPHWLTVATAGFHRLCSPAAPKPRNGGCDSASRPVFPARATCLIASRADAARRLVSWSFDAGRNDPP